jgi:hypothetical protein
MRFAAAVLSLGLAAPTARGAGDRAASRIG